MFQFSTIPEALEALKNGGLILVTDDEDRENEGDFICAAEFATTENVNFIAGQGADLHADERTFLRAASSASDGEAKYR